MEKKRLCIFNIDCRVSDLQVTAVGERLNVQFNLHKTPTYTSER